MLGCQFLRQFQRQPRLARPADAGQQPERRPRFTQRPRLQVGELPAAPDQRRQPRLPPQPAQNRPVLVQRPGLPVPFRLHPLVLRSLPPQLRGLEPQGHAGVFLNPLVKGALLDDPDVLPPPLGPALLRPRLGPRPQPRGDEHEDGGLLVRPAVLRQTGLIVAVGLGERVFRHPRFPIRQARRHPHRPSARRHDAVVTTVARRVGGGQPQPVDHLFPRQQPVKQLRQPRPAARLGRPPIEMFMLQCRHRPRTPPPAGVDRVHWNTILMKPRAWPQHRMRAQNKRAAPTRGGPSVNRNPDPPKDQSFIFGRRVKLCCASM